MGMGARRLGRRHWYSPLTRHLHPHDELRTYLLDQDNVSESLSTSEAEFVATSQAGQEALYLREALKDFGYQQNTTTEIYEDNLSCVDLWRQSVMLKIRCAANFRARDSGHIRQNEKFFELPNVIQVQVKI